MAFTNADLLAIKGELTNDPASLGLVAPPALDDVGNAQKLNAVDAQFQVDRESVPAQEIFQNIDRDEYVALALADRQWLDAVTGSGSVNPKTGSEVREGLLQLFADGSETRTNLLAILTSDASRIDYLHSLGTLSQGGTITPSDVANARNAV